MVLMDDLFNERPEIKINSPLEERFGAINLITIRFLGLIVIKIDALRP